MSNQIQNSISIGQETAWGTPTTPSVSVPVNFTGGIQINRDVQIISSLKNKLAKNVFSTLGNSVYEGEFEIPLLADRVGDFLFSWFGHEDVTGTTPAFSHTFVETEEKISYTIEQNLQAICRRFSGCLINSIKFTLAVGQPITYTIGIKAKGSSEETAITGVYSDLTPFNSADALLKLDTVEIPELQTLEIELLNNIEMKHTIGQGGEPAYKYQTGSEVNVTFEGYLDETTKAQLYDKFSVGTPIALDLTMTGGTNSLQILIPKLVLTTSETPIAEDYNKISGEGKAIYDEDTSELVSAILINDIETYTPS